MNLPLAYPLVDHLVVLPSHDQLLLLNPTARLIWEGLDAGREAEVVAEQIAASYRIPRDTALKDVRTVLETIIELRRTATHLDEIHGPSEPSSEREAAIQHRYRLKERVIQVSFPNRSFERMLHPRLSQWATKGEPAEVSVALLSDEKGLQVRSSLNGSVTPVEATEASGLLQRNILDCVYPETAWMLMLHAGAVCRDGHCIVLPGRKGKGKSTLVAGLVSEGFCYLGDDFIPIDNAGKVASFPTRVNLKSGSWPVLQSRLAGLREIPVVEAGDFAIKYWSHPRPVPFGERKEVSHLVFPQFDCDREPFCRKLTPVETVQKLVWTESWFSRDPKLAQCWINWIEETASYEIGYRSLEEAFFLLSNLTERGSF